MELGRRRARGVVVFMLGLPGGAYLYQGEELGLPDHTTLPEATPGPHLCADRRRTHWPRRLPHPAALAGTKPASASAATTFGAPPWLPQPAGWGDVARDVQAAEPPSHLALYRNALQASSQARPGYRDTALGGRVLHRAIPGFPQRHHPGAAQHRHHPIGAAPRHRLAPFPSSSSRRTSPNQNHQRPSGSAI